MYILLFSVLGFLKKALEILRIIIIKCPTYLISRELILELLHLGFSVMDDALGLVNSLNTVLGKNKRIQGQLSAFSHTVIKTQFQLGVACS